MLLMTLRPIPRKIDMTALTDTQLLNLVKAQHPEIEVENYTIQSMMVETDHLDDETELQSRLTKAIREDGYFEIEDAWEECSKDIVTRWKLPSGWIGLTLVPNVGTNMGRKDLSGFFVMVKANG